MKALALALQLLSLAAGVTAGLVTLDLMDQATAVMESVAR